MESISAFKDLDNYLSDDDDKGNTKRVIGKVLERAFLGAYLGFD
jgi:hypothetical protein